VLVKALREALRARTGAKLNASRRRNRHLHEENRYFNEGKKGTIARMITFPGRNLQFP
jgi:hypothetical protein